MWSCRQQTGIDRIREESWELKRKDNSCIRKGIEININPKQRLRKRNNNGLKEKQWSKKILDKRCNDGMVDIRNGII